MRHFKIYVGVGSALLCLFWYLIVLNFEGWRLYLAMFALFFVYGVGRYPIVRDTNEGDPDEDKMSLSWLLVKWFVIASFVAVFCFVIETLRSL